MIMKRYLIITAAAAAMISCSRVSVSDSSITVRADDGTAVRLIPVTPSIIRVSAVPRGAAFSDKESLCVLPQTDEVAFTVTKTDSTVAMSTSALTATVSLGNGRVSYHDASGCELTSENMRSFAPIEVDGTCAWTVRQTFDSPEDEAFFGLGQHQADEWNYKGKSEELYQYNTKISVPFIISSRGYGILWDSYSFCRFGDPRDYSQLGDVFRLYDAAGVEGALTGTYLQSPEIGKTALVRRETALNQEFLIEPELAKVEGAPDGFRFGGSHVTYDGFLEAPETGTYSFLLYYAGYTTVTLGGEVVVPEIWRTAWNPNSRKFRMHMEAGQKMPLHIDWDPDGDVSYCALKVLSPRSDAESQLQSWWGEMQDQIDYYLIAGGSSDAVISGMRTLTGKAQILPKWAMGYWQSRERYRTQEEILSTLAQMRSRHIPVDNIVQDWQYWEDDQWGSHEFDATRFPDPQAMVDSIHALGARYMISVWPKFYTGTEHFRELDEKGWIYQTAVRDSIEDWLGYQQSFYDAYAPGARTLFWEQMRQHLFGLGVDAWWMDASEPNIHDCTDMDYRKAMCGPTALGPSTQYFNAYGLMNAMAIYDGQRSVAPDQRVFLLTRSGFVGQQRYSTASWSGDIGTRWEDMKTQISAGLNFAMSGIPFWTQDIGGFSVENRYAAAVSAYEQSGRESEDLREWRELQTRWHQVGMFNPLYRSHGQYPFREFWNIAPAGSPAYETILRCDRMRYALMPYIYTLASRVHFDDYTIMRPLAMDYMDDLAAREISDQFMFGDAIMVCPVYTYGARSREVYLPEGTWYDLGAGSCAAVQGGRRFTAAAPYEHIPVYARAGQIVVCGPQIEYTSQAQDASLDVYVFAGADAAFSLYEDDGVSYAYENGACSWIPFQWDEKNSLLSIGGRRGSWEGMPGARDIRVTVVTPEGRRSQSVRYEGLKLVIDVFPAVAENLGGVARVRE